MYLTIHVSLLFEDPLASYRVNSYMRLYQGPNLVCVHETISDFMASSHFSDSGTSYSLLVGHRLILIHE